MINLSSVARTLALAIALILVTAPNVAFGQADQHQHGQNTQGNQMKMGQAGMQSTMMDEMAAKKKANTERIDALMARVKNESGEAKVAAMADVMTILLEERAAMQEHCATMCATMHK